MSDENNKKDVGQNNEQNKEQNNEQNKNETPEKGKEYLINGERKTDGIKVPKNQLDEIKREVFGDRTPTAEEEADFEEWLENSLNRVYEAIKNRVDEGKEEEQVEADFLDDDEIVTGSISAKEKEKMDECWWRVMCMHGQRRTRIGEIKKIKFGLLLAWLAMNLVQLSSEHGTPLNYIALAMGLTIAIAYADFTMKEGYARASLEQADELFQDCSGGFGLAVMSGEILSRKGEGLIVKIDNSSKPSREVVCYIDDVEWQSKIKFKKGTKVSVAEVIRHGRTPCYFIVGEAEK